MEDCSWSRLNASKRHRIEKRETAPTCSTRPSLSNPAPKGFTKSTRCSHSVEDINDTASLCTLGQHYCDVATIARLLRIWLHTNSPPSQQCPLSPQPRSQRSLIISSSRVYRYIRFHLKLCAARNSPLTMNVSLELAASS